MEIQHPLKKQATWTFYYAYDGILFIIAILVNSKQLIENEKTLIVMDFFNPPMANGGGGMDAPTGFSNFSQK